MDEEEPIKLGWDHQTFVVDGQPFYPDLTDTGNTVLVRLPCQPHADLKWAIPITSKRILWEFVCGLEEPFFPLTDELPFQSLILACKHFSQTIWPRYKDQTLGAILYRGSIDLSENFLWNDVQRANYAAWSEEHPSPDPYRFCADAFCSYFQLLAHQLPEELPLVLCFDPKSMPSLSRALNLLSREHFDHFLIAVSSPRWPTSSLYWENSFLSFRPVKASIGFCFPKDSYMNEDLFFRIDKILEGLYESNQSFRVIFEEFLTEQWENLDEIRIIPEALSAQGRRKLAGFEAAGGIVREIE